MSVVVTGNLCEILGENANIGFLADERGYNNDKVIEVTPVSLGWVLAAGNYVPQGI